MNVADSSVWIEVLFHRPNEAHFKPILLDLANLLVPSITIYEVVRYATPAANRDFAQSAAQMMERATVVGLDAALGRNAARYGLRYNLSAADSIIYATAQAHHAALYTQDADLGKLPGVKYTRARR